MTKRETIPRRENIDSLLVKIPILGFFFRMLKNNQKEIEQALETGKETRGKRTETSFFGIVKIMTDKTFHLLQFTKR